MYFTTNLDAIPERDRNIGGWIAPDGRFWRARWGEHDEVAGKIVRGALCPKHEVYIPGDYLVGLGWIRLETWGDVWRMPTNPTGQQFDVLCWCYARGGDDEYNLSMFKLVTPLGSMWERGESSRLPLPPQGDQENVNLHQWRQEVYA